MSPNILMVRPAFFRAFVTYISQKIKWGSLWTLSLFWNSLFVCFLIVPLSPCSWRSSAAFFSPQLRRRFRRAWWTTSACSSLSAVAPSALPSLLSFRRRRQLKPTRIPTDGAGAGTPVTTQRDDLYTCDEKYQTCLYSVINCPGFLLIPPQQNVSYHSLKQKAQFEVGRSRIRWLQLYFYIEDVGALLFLAFLGVFWFLGWLPTMHKGR